MADLRISEMPVATLPLAGTEATPILQGGVNTQTTPNAIVAPVQNQVNTIQSTLPALVRTQLVDALRPGTNITLTPAGSGASQTLTVTARGTDLSFDAGSNQIRSSTGASAQLPPLTLLPATTTQLGGIKVGDGLDVTSQGVLSAPLPIATTSSPGGIKVGRNLVVAPDGTLDAQADGIPGPPGPAGPAGPEGPQGPSGAAGPIVDSGLTMGPAHVLGRFTAGDGPVEEVALAPSIQAVNGALTPVMGGPGLIGTSATGFAPVEEIRLGTGLSFNGNTLDSTVTGPIVDSGLTMHPAHVLGRFTAGDGPIEEVALSPGMQLLGGMLVPVMSGPGLTGTSATGLAPVEEIRLGTGLSFDGKTLNGSRFFFDLTLEVSPTGTANPASPLPVSEGGLAEPFALPSQAFAYAATLLTTGYITVNVAAGTYTEPADYWHARADVIMWIAGEGRDTTIINFPSGGGYSGDGGIGVVNITINGTIYTTFRHVLLEGATVGAGARSGTAFIFDLPVPLIISGACTVNGRIQMANAGINFLNWSAPPNLAVNAGTAPGDTAIFFSGACGIRPTVHQGPVITLTGPGKTIWIESSVSLIPTTARFWAGDPVFVYSEPQPVRSDTTTAAGSSAIGNMLQLSQAQYDAIATKDPATFYVITS